MGIGFYIEPKEKESEENTYALFSSYTDTFLHKGLSIKELIFYYMDSGSKISNLKNSFYHIRELDISMNPDSYRDAKGLDLNDTFLEGIQFYAHPIKIDDGKYVIYNSFEDNITLNIISRDDAIDFLKVFYLDIFSERYCKSFIDMIDNTNYKDLISYNSFGEEKSIMFKQINDLIPS